MSLLSQGSEGASNGQEAPNTPDATGQSSNATEAPLGAHSEAGAQTIDHSKDTGWFYDDGKPGEGNRPDWLLSKFKTAAEQARSFAEAEKRLGAFKGAPETYDLTVPEMPDVKFHPEDPFIKEFLDDAKKNNVSQDYVTNLLHTYVKMQKASVPNPDKEMEKLGPNAKRDLQVLAQWGNNHLSKEEFAVFKNMITTAEAVRLFEKFRTLSSNPDTQPPGSKSYRESEAEVRKLVHDPRFETDEDFRNDVHEKLKQFA